MFEAECEPMVGIVGGVKCLLSLALLPDWCIYILLEHVSHWVPGLTESEATGPVKVSGVKPDLNGLLYHMVYISCGLIQDGDATEIDVVPSLKSMLVAMKAYIIHHYYYYYYAKFSHAGINLQVLQVWREGFLPP
jgi:hypothetical protein